MITNKIITNNKRAAHFYEINSHPFIYFNVNYRIYIDNKFQYFDRRSTLEVSCRYVFDTMCVCMCV